MRQAELHLVGGVADGMLAAPPSEAAGGLAGAALRGIREETRKAGDGRTETEGGRSMEKESATVAFVNPDYLRELFDYNPATGKFIWRERPLEHFSSRRGCSTWNAQHAGREAFITKNSNGYLMASVDKRRIKAHRAAWAIHYGTWTDQIIDHVNGNSLDNRIDNLRLASPADNSRNQRIRSDNKVGLKGVYFHRAAGKYGAQIAVGGKPKHLGLFDTPEAAHAAYCMAAKEKHGAFANDGEKPI